MVAKTRSKGSKGKATREALRVKRIERVVDARIEMLDEILSFRGFLSCSFEPHITDVEIIVCFADLRGFSAYCHDLQREMQDRKLHNFLKSYVKVFNEGIVEWMARNITVNGKLDPAQRTALKKAIVPTAYKHLGDGAMLVWEIPNSVSAEIQNTLSFEVVWLLDFIRDRFHFRFRNLSADERDGYSEKVLKLDMGFGIARGHAWKLDFGSHSDYAGSVINMAARMQEFARPGGIVAHYDLSTSFFRDAASDRFGTLVSLALKGFEKPVHAWVSPEVDLQAQGITERFPPKKRRL